MVFEGEMDIMLQRKNRKKPVLPLAIRQLSFGEILKEFGRKNDLFYVIDSKEIKYTLSLLRPFRTNDFSILYLDKGELTVDLGVTTHHLKQGSLLIKSREEILQVRHFSADCHFRIFGFTESLITASGLAKKHLDTFAFLKIQSSPALAIPSGGETSLVDLFNILHQKSQQKEKSPYYDEAIQHAFVLVAFEVATLHSREQDNQLSVIGRKEHLAIEFLRLLQLHNRQERSVSFYASQLNVTPKYLSKCVKGVTGKSCGILIDEAVILEAKVLLDDPELTINQVADRLHFSDQFFFSKYFKKYSGKSPTAYRSTF
jgi:AraC family transcriptional regulator, transcriptional activator of pobA